ncbi:MAG: hypothetical protein KAJ01_02490 [Candidatus Hydrogenedentes bacterium]|nr:hypothetical protein [Candidatus Hydrogenedentota bacterium]
MYTYWDGYVSGWLLGLAVAHVVQGNFKIAAIVMTVSFLGVFSMWVGRKCDT